MRNFQQLALSIRMGRWSDWKVFGVLTIAFLFCGCGKSIVLDSASDESAVKLSSGMREGLVAAISATPYTALVQLKDFTQIKTPSNELSNTSPSEIRVEYRADVFETLRGVTHKQITFYQIIEDGEEPMSIGSQFIITLCRDSSGYFWPGTGSVFPNTEQVLNVARSAAKAPLDNEIIDAYCF